MNREQWLRRLKGWWQAHPLRSPPAYLQAGYTEEVMARIRTLRAAPAPAPERSLWPLWWVRMRPALALGGALACALAVAVWVGQSPSALFRQAQRDSDLLLEVGEVAWMNGGDLEEELRLQDRIVLAQALEESPQASSQEGRADARHFSEKAAGAARNVEEAIQIWEDLEALDTLPPDVMEEADSEEWLKALESIDETDWTVSS